MLRIPKPGETILGGEFHTAPGGKGANQAVAAARIGGKIAMVGRVGTDPFGDNLLANLKAAGGFQNPRHLAKRRRLVRDRVPLPDIRIVVDRYAQVGRGDAAGTA